MKTTANDTMIQAATAAPTSPIKKTPAQVMNAILSSEGTKKLLENTLHENSGAFTASVLDLYNSDKLLQSCPAQEVFAECLKAVSLKLPINKQLGFAYVIPYKGHAQFQLGYKGLLQLCMRTGAYKHINAGPVYEGELVKVDKLTGMVDLSGEQLSEEVIGYFAYIETINGFSKALYWSKPRLIEHAKKFSKSYQQGAQIWRDNFDEMATKTVLRNLLSKWGVMSVEMTGAMEDDRAEIADKVIQGEPEPVPAEYQEIPAEG